MNTDCVATAAQLASKLLLVFRAEGSLASELAISRKDIYHDRVVKAQGTPIA